MICEIGYDLHDSNRCNISLSQFIIVTAEQTRQTKIKGFLIRVGTVVYYSIFSSNIRIIKAIGGSVIRAIRHFPAALVRCNYSRDDVAPMFS